MNYPDEYKKYQNLPQDELAEIMAGHEGLGSKSNIARLVYEENQMKEQRKYQKEQIQLQDELNKENIILQHENNIKIVSKQLKLGAVTK